MSSAKKSFKAVKGMNDILPGAKDAFLDSTVWDFILQQSKMVLEGYGYSEIRLPVVEETQLFARGLGEDTDIVGKEMYTFEDRGGRSLTLRPEGTASAARSYVENNFSRNNPVQKWWYFGPMYRAERPQKGRYRQFYQIGAEVFGVSTPASEAEMLMMLSELIQRLGVVEVRLRLNTLGDDESRSAYRKSLIEYLEPKKDELCESCSGRLHSNPLRVLDCKRPQCSEVVAQSPDVLDCLTPSARMHFDRVRALLDEAQISYDRDRRLVRGLDYYTGTIFEFTTGELGAQDAILGGGRYDELVSELGGSQTPAVGFAAGVERLALLVAQTVERQNGPDLYLIPMEELETEAFKLASKVRGDGRWKVGVDVGGGKVKQQFKRADRSGARFALVLGEDELANGRGKVKNLATGESTEIALEANLIGEYLGGK